jgi:hypothetical protein
VPDTIFLADIAKNDYASFLSLPGHDFPDTYDEWLKLLNNQTKHYRSLGHPIVYVRVNADEFAHFCAPRGTGHDLNNIYRLIFEKAFRQQK